MAGFTNRGKYLIMQQVFNNTGAPTNYYVALVTSAAAPTAATNLLSELTQITAGTGYTAGGISLAKNVTDFPSLTEDDVNNRGSIKIKDLTWTAAGGSLGAARYAVLTDDNVTVGSRQVYAYWDLGADRTVSDGQTLTLQALELRLNEV